MSLPPWHADVEAAHIAPIRYRFAGRLRGQLVLLDGMSGNGNLDPGEDGPSQQPDRNELFTIAHQVAGVASALGGERLGAAAAALAQALHLGQPALENPELEPLFGEFLSAAHEFLDWVAPLSENDGVVEELK